MRDPKSASHGVPSAAEFRRLVKALEKLADRVDVLERRLEDARASAGAARSSADAALYVANYGGRT